ncbi:tRNA synthetases class II-domain-containing protein [Xylaria nigripes]|nr:tRNA synthetases class II-domain-containing protein [Xylaria nigripes]
MIRASATRPLSATSRFFSRVRGPSILSSSLHFCRQLRQDSKDFSQARSVPAGQESQFEVFKKSFSFPGATDPIAYRRGRIVCVHGFLGKGRKQNKKLSFYEVRLNTPNYATIQVTSSWESEETLDFSIHKTLESIPPYSPVCIKGVLGLKVGKDPEAPLPPKSFEDNFVVAEEDSEDSESTDVSWHPAAFELKPLSIQCLNTFPKDIIVSRDVVWPPKSRHLQMRFDRAFYERLRFRNTIASKLAHALRSMKFMEVETPVLFKSTPEGAREFLVPTRRKGFAYALPQSPQQYKQMLMAGGIVNYFQFAKCFRDEDHRADRQPEFTQLDLEMSFATGKDVMNLVTKLINVALKSVPRGNAPWLERTENLDYAPPSFTIRSMTYKEAMSNYGIDKPDLRIGVSLGSKIINISDWLSPDFKSKITSIKEPIVEAFKFRFPGGPKDSAEFTREFFDTLSSTSNKQDGDSAPGVFIFDSSKPLQGLSALGHEAAEQLANHVSESWRRCEPGDVIIIGARENLPAQGGSTELGRLRKLMYDAAVEKRLFPKDLSLHFLWVSGFPLFSLNEEDPGQGGSAGFSATHHPFTAPLSPKDVDLLMTDPLKATADHYDLVLNGVEVGGGSRRIHVAEVQEFIMRNVLKMTDEGVGQFSHLLEALRAGCPPHAGFALGFDRLMAILCDVPSVREVIAFPKDNKGNDKLVGSPSKMTYGQQKTYHLLTESKPENTSE